MSALADGIHSYNSEIGPVINECRIENLGDDAVAIHGFFTLMKKTQLFDNVLTALLILFWRFTKI